MLTWAYAYMLTKRKDLTTDGLEFILLGLFDCGIVGIIGSVIYGVMTGF